MTRSKKSEVKNQVQILSVIFSIYSNLLSLLYSQFDSCDSNMENVPLLVSIFLFEMGVISIHSLVLLHSLRNLAISLRNYLSFQHKFHALNYSSQSCDL